jgi:hypothetical protein
VIKIVIGIRNSTTVTEIETTPKTDKINAKVCPKVNKLTNKNTRFQSLNVYGISKAIRKTTWS